MSYRIEFHAKGDAETWGLPPAAFTALITVLQVVARAPYDTETTVPTSDPHVREAVFATWGLVAFWIDDHRQVVHVHGIAWAG